MKICILTAFLLVSETLAASTVNGLPRVFFEYSFLYDANCAVTPERRIEAAWAAEARAKSQQFERAWQTYGPRFFAPVYDTFGRGFSRSEMTATLSVCPTPSYSNPLVLNVTKYLDSFMSPAVSKGDESFAALVFHELMHTWISENVGTSTPLLLKYEKESSTVRNHLHVMAVQKFVYTRLGREDLLRNLDQQYRNMPNPAYPRAWKIVSEIEGYENFIREIPHRP